MRASGYERVASDWYREPAWIVDALLEVEKFDGLVLDPACGAGNIPERVIASGGEAVGSDVADRGYGTPGVDFLEWHGRVSNICSNPPYGIIENFIRHALDVADKKVAILARLALLEGIKRREMFRSTPLARVWVSSKRVSMPPGGSDIEAKGGSIAYAWFVFERGHVGPAVIGWI